MSVTLQFGYQPAPISTTEVREVPVFARMWCGEHEAEHAATATLDLNRLQQLRQVVVDNKVSAVMISAEKGTHFDLKTYEWAMAKLVKDIAPETADTPQYAPNDVHGTVGTELHQSVLDSLTEPDATSEADVSVNGQRLMISDEGIWFEGYIPDKHQPEDVESEMIKFDDMEAWWSKYGAP